MSLISQIDALPDDMKVLCGSFAYGFIEGSEEYSEGGLTRVGADVYYFEPSYWYLGVFEPCSIERSQAKKENEWHEFYGFDVDYEESRDHFHSQWAEYINGERHVLEDIERTDCKDRYLRSFAEHVGDIEEAEVPIGQFKVGGKAWIYGFCAEVWEKKEQ